MLCRTAGIVICLSVAAVGCRTGTQSWSARWQPAPQPQYNYADQYQYPNYSPPVAAAPTMVSAQPAEAAQPIATAQPAGSTHTVVPASVPTSGFVPPPLPPAED